MADLHWFPYDVDEWDERTRELSIEEEGALTRLCRHAWNHKELPCTIADSESAFDRALGSKWKKLLPFIRQHFTPIEGTPGRLRCEWLHRIYERQLKKHESYQQRGGAGGRAKASRAPKSEHSSSSADSSATSPASSSARKRTRRIASSALAAGVADSRESTAESTNSGPSDHRVSTPASGDALAREGALAAAVQVEPPPPVVDERPPAGAEEVEAAEAWLATQPDREAELQAAIDKTPIDFLDPEIRAAVRARSAEQPISGTLRLAPIVTMRQAQRRSLLLHWYRSRDATPPPAVASS